MSYFRRCQTCQEWGWFDGSILGNHVCAPIWECRPEWNGADDDAWQNVHASDAEGAAEKCAAQYDRDGGYTIVSCGGGEEYVIQVRKPGDEEFTRWEIEAEAVPTYQATEVK